MSVIDDATLERVFSGAAVLFLGFVVENGVSFVGKILVARHLAPDGFGEVSLGVALLTTTASVLVVGLDTGTARFLPRTSDATERRGIVVSGMQIGLLLPTTTGLLLAVFPRAVATAAFGDPSTATQVRLVGIGLPLVAFVKLAIGVLQGNKQASPKVAINNFTLPLTRFLGYVAAAVVGLGAVGVLGAYLVSYVVGAVVAVYYLWRRTTLFRRTPAQKQYKRLLYFSAPLAVSSLGSSVFSRIDVLLIGRLIGTTDVGVYTAVYPISMLTLLSLNVLSFLFLPVLSGLDADEETAQMRRLYQVVTKWAFFGAFPLLFVMAVFPDLVIELTFGADYRNGALTLSALVFGVGTHTLLGPNAQALTATGNTRTVMYGSLFGAASNLLANLVLIPRFSILGAAVSTSISYTLMNGLFSAVLYRRHGFIPFSAGQFAPLLATSAVAGAVSVWLPTAERVTFAVTLGVFLTVYPVTVLNYGGVGEEERSLVDHLGDE